MKGGHNLKMNKKLKKLIKWYLRAMSETGRYNISIT